MQDAVTVQQDANRTEVKRGSSTAAALPFVQAAGIGVDIGSTWAKAVAVDGAGTLIASVCLPTGWSSKEALKAIQQALAEQGILVDEAPLVATGYGREAVANAAKRVTEITCHARRAVREENAVRRSLKRFYSTMRHEPTPMTGHDMFKVLYGTTFKLDRSVIPAEIDALTDTIEKEYAAGKRQDKKPRILITGCPMGGATEKVIRAIEENGGVVVAYENCTGTKNVERLVDEEAEDIYQALAERYLAIGCSVMTPNPNRYESLDSLIDEYHVDGVVEMVLQACHTYSVESKSIRDFVTKKKNIPYIYIETDYSTTDVGQLSTRLAAFVEML